MMSTQKTKDLILNSSVFYLFFFHKKSSRTILKTSSSVLIPLIKHAERVFEMASQMKGNGLINVNETLVFDEVFASNTSV